MAGAVIVDVVRTACGLRNGGLSGWHPADLAAELLGALQVRNNLDPALVDDVILGCVVQVGAQSANVARNAVLGAGWPDSVPATTVDRQCGSSLQAVHFAAQGVLAGAYDVVVAGGVELMSLVPLGASLSGFGSPFGPRMVARYAERGGLVPQGVAAELVAAQWDLTRDDLDAYALRSQRLAAQAVAEARFCGEIVAVAQRLRDASGTGAASAGAPFAVDEGIRMTDAAELAALLPVNQPGGRVTAGNSAQIADGASAALIMSEERATQLGLRPRARFHSFALAGVDPLLALTGPIPATQRALARAGLTMDDIDVTEINEAFAAVVLAWQAELRPDPARVNPNGGAIALGHPLGSSGTRLLASLVNDLERTGGRYGLVTMCEGGGMANATIIERLG